MDEQNDGEGSTAEVVFSASSFLITLSNEAVCTEPEVAYAHVCLDVAPPGIPFFSAYHGARNEVLHPHLHIVVSNAVSNARLQTMSPLAVKTACRVFCDFAETQSVCSLHPITHANVLAQDAERWAALDVLVALAEHAEFRDLVAVTKVARAFLTRAHPAQRKLLFREFSLRYELHAGRVSPAEANRILLEIMPLPSQPPVFAVCIQEYPLGTFLLPPADMVQAEYAAVLESVRLQEVQTAMRTLGLTFALPTLTANLPPHTGCTVVVAGGFLCRALSLARRRGGGGLSHKAYEGSDIDLFIIGTNVAPAHCLAILEQLACAVEQTSSTGYRSTIEHIYCTESAVSIVARRVSQTARKTEYVKYQLIVVHHRSVAELLLGFDVDSCCLAYDGVRLLALPRGLRAHSKHVNFTSVHHATADTAARLLKYNRRGFTVCDALQVFRDSGAYNGDTLQENLTWRAALGGTFAASAQFWGTPYDDLRESTNTFQDVVTLLCSNEWLPRRALGANHDEDDRMTQLLEMLSSRAKKRKLRIMVERLTVHGVFARSVAELGDVIANLALLTPSQVKAAGFDAGERVSVARLPGGQAAHFTYYKSRGGEEVHTGGGVQWRAAAAPGIDPASFMGRDM